MSTTTCPDIVASSDMAAKPPRCAARAGTSCAQRGCLACRKSSRARASGAFRAIDEAARGGTLLAHSQVVTTGALPKPSTRPGPRDRAVLFVIAGPQQGAVFQLHGTSIWLGHGAQVGVDLEDDAVSTRHAHFTRRADGVYLQDGGSHNGTFVNDEPVGLPRRLVDGNHVHVGNTILKFCLLDVLEEHALTQLFELTIHDPLTHAYNRRYLTAHLRSELAFAARQGQSLALLLVDIDHFKRVNDTYGHRVGDSVLQLVAASIQRILRPYDVLCRYGGEEFVIVARDTSLRNAEILAERVRRCIERMHFDVGGKSASITVSVGVTAVRPSGAVNETETLLQAIDEALYAAKEAGRNRVKVAAPGGPSRARHDAVQSRPARRKSGEQPSSVDVGLDARPSAFPRFD